MFRDDEIDDVLDDGDDESLPPMRAPVQYVPPHEPARRSSPSFLEQLRARGLIKPDGTEQEQLQHMFDRAVRKAMSEQQRTPHTPHDQLRRGQLPPHDVRVELDDAVEGEEGYAFGWAGALALLGLGWFLASFAREGK